MNNNPCALGFVDLNASVSLRHFSDKSLAPCNRRVYARAGLHAYFKDGIDVYFKYEELSSEAQKKIDGAVKEAIKSTEKLCQTIQTSPPLTNHKSIFIMDLLGVIFLNISQYVQKLIAATPSAEERSILKKGLEGFLRRISFANLQGYGSAAIKANDFLLKIQEGLNNVTPSPIGENEATIFKIARYAIKHPALLIGDLGMFAGYTEDKGESSELKISIELLKRGFRLLLIELHKVVAQFISKKRTFFSDFKTCTPHPDLMYAKEICNELEKLQSEINLLQKLANMTLHQLMENTNRNSFLTIRHRFYHLVKKEKKIFPDNWDLLSFFQKKIDEVKEKPSPTGLYELQSFLPEKMASRKNEKGQRTLRELKKIELFLREVYISFAYLESYINGLFETVGHSYDSMHGWFVRHAKENGKIDSLLKLAEKQRENFEKGIQTLPADLSVPKKRSRRKKKSRRKIEPEPLTPFEKKFSFLLIELNQGSPSAELQNALTQPIFRLQLLLEKYEAFLSNQRVTFLDALLFLESAHSCLQELLIYYKLKKGDQRPFSQVDLVTLFESLSLERKIDTSVLEDLNLIARWNEEIYTAITHWKKTEKIKTANIGPSSPFLYDLFLLAQNEEAYEEHPFSKEPFVERLKKVFERIGDFSLSLHSQFSLPSSKSNAGIQKQENQEEYDLTSEKKPKNLEELEHGLERFRTDWLCQENKLKRRGLSEKNREIILDLQMLIELKTKFSGKMTPFHFPILVQKTVQVTYCLFDRLMKVIFILQKNKNPKVVAPYTLFQEINWKKPIRTEEVFFIQNHFHQMPIGNRTSHSFEDRNHPFQRLISHSLLLHQKGGTTHTPLSIKDQLLDAVNNLIKFINRFLIPQFK